MQAFLRAVQAIIRRAPALTVAVVVVLTAVFGALTTLQESSQGFEGFLPANEFTTTQERIAELFGAEDVEAMQVAVYDDDGDVLSARGVGMAMALRDEVTSTPALADALAETSSGAIVTWADLVIQSATEQGLDPLALTDAQVDQLYAAALTEIPAAQQGLLTAMLGGDRGENSATAGMAILFLRPDAVNETGDSPAQQALVGLNQDIDGFEVRPFDIAAMTGEMSDVITQQLGMLLGLAVLLIVGILIALYRRPVDVIVSLLGLGFTIVWMQGISALLGPGGLGWTGGQSEMTMAIPILLVGLGVDYAIHLTMRYREERASHGDPTESATAAIWAVGAALALATVTTVVGFLTNLTNPLPPLADFGVFAAVGILSAFLVMLTFVPAVRLLVDRRRAAAGRLPGERSQSQEPGLLGRLAAMIAPTAVNRPSVILAGAAVVTVIGGFGATQLTTEFSQTDFFPSNSEALATLERTQEAFGGDITETTRVLVTGDLARPTALNAMVAYQDGLADIEGVRPDVVSDSVVMRLRGMKAAIEEGMASGDMGEFPEGVDPALVEEFALTLLSSGFDTPDGVAHGTDVEVLYEGLLALDPSTSGVLAQSTGGSWDAALFDVATSVGEEVDGIRTTLVSDGDVLLEAGLDRSMTSEGLMVDLVMRKLRNSQVSGLVVTLLASMLILVVAFWVRERKPMLGVLAILTVAVVVAWAFGIMAALGIPFNVMTAMVSSLAIGIGVPFGIHVVNRFLEDRKTHNSTLGAMTDTLRNTGGAMVGSALTTMAGFGVLVLSNIPPMRQFGIVLAVTIGLALLSAVIVLPAMLALWARRHPWDDDPEHLELDAGQRREPASV